MSDIKEHINYKKLQFILDVLDLEFPVADLARKTGYSEATISPYLSGKVKPSTKFLQSVINSFDFDVNRFVEIKSDDINIVSEPNDIYRNKNGNKFKELESGKFIMTVPLVPAKAYATYISECCEGDFIDGFSEVNFYVDQFARGNYVAFEIKGDSMDNGGLYDNPEGCVTLCRELGRQHWKDGFREAKYGWVIIHKDSIVCKDIVDLNLEAGTIICHSRNAGPEYPDFTIELNDVKQIFKIIKRTF